MIDEMAEPVVEPQRTFMTAEQAELRERVHTHGRQLISLENDMRNGFSQLQASLKLLADEFRGATKTQWPLILTAIGVSFTIAVAAGSQILAPIKEDVRETESAIIETNKAIQAAVATFVTRQEMDWRAERGSEDRVRTETAISDLRSGTVARNEWNEKNHSRDNDISNIRESQAAADANLQRQLDQQRADFLALTNSLGNGRDTFQDMRDQIRRLEERLDAWRMRRMERTQSQSPLQ